MKDLTLSRRAVMLGTAALPMVQSVTTQTRPKPVVISSANRNNGGVNCCAKAMEIIKSGGDTLDAVIAGVNIVELDPRDNSVGYGGLPNEDGVVELDASCVHGPSRRMGAVGALQGIKTPSKVAKLVMEQTDHMMLVGAGALRFAKDMGLPRGGSAHRGIAHGVAGLEEVAARSPRPYQLGTGGGRPAGEPASRMRGEVLKELREMFPRVDEYVLERAWEYAIHPPHGTINCIAIKRQGRDVGGRPPPAAWLGRFRAD